MTDPSPAVHLPRHTLRRRGMGLMVLTTGAAALLMGFRAPTVATALGADTLGSGSGATDVSTALASASPAPMASGAPSGAACVVPDPAASLVPGASPAAPCASPTSSAVPSQSAAAVTQQVLTGQGVETGFGVVQVSVTVEGTTIVDVQAVALPYDRPRSREISSIVEPMLRQEALQAQSAQIDLISGATYTSEGYSMSLQSALDQVAK